MEIWAQFIQLIVDSIQFLTGYFDGQQALAIIVFTLLVRLLLMPVQIKSSMQMVKNKAALAKLKPKLEQLKAQHGQNPQVLFEKTSALYKKNNVQLFGKYSLMNLFSQGVLGIAIFQSIKSMLLSSPFAWIANIARPDVGLALVVGVLTYMATIVAPGMAEQGNMLIILMPAVLSIIVVSMFPSALGLFWATSNVTSIMQSLYVNKVTAKSIDA